ncbi:lipopolysaccharide assembly protein LapB [Pedobacter sp. SYSU D00535]|uniref:tetratricopeptide repeat protein n=1 Tax=Pedobacter sp. SYSU D00535 TaxID=2810308 RepID=UPI001A971C10|nr:tetratricopeptide repeat protein [Pedobacter sp. SYSU D00535]
MKIKSLIVAIAVMGASAPAFAQKGAVNTAKTEYEKYAAMKAASPKLAEPAIKAAKEAVDKAVVHEKTLNDPTAWTYKALIYADLALADTAFKSDDKIAEAANAVQKAVSLDKDGANKANIARANTLLGYYERGKGLQNFKAKNWANAYTAFNSGLKYIPKDTIIAYYAGASAQNAGNFAGAIESYSSILDQNYSFLEDVYINLAESYAANKDTANAMRTLSAASAKFPANSNLVKREIELGLNSGKYKETISKIEAQAAKEPGNKLYPFYLGIAYNSVKDYKKAEEAYQKAISIDPNFGDAYINLGGLIMNNGIDTYNKANKLPASKTTEFNALRKQAVAEFDRALPYLEKASQINPKSNLALQNLKQYYMIKNNSAKAAEIDAKIKALQ